LANLCFLRHGGHAPFYVASKKGNSEAANRDIRHKTGCGITGDPTPSQADIHLTRVLRDAAKIIDVELADHVIIGDPKADPQGQGWYSFRQSGLL